MKPWIKTMIKQGEVGYLVYKSGNKLITRPFFYTYKSGRLSGNLPVLFADQVIIMKRNPFGVITIHHADKLVKLEVKITIHENYVSNSQMKSSLQYMDNTDYSDLIYFEKQVYIELIPTKITGISREEHISYELEIL